MQAIPRLDFEPNTIELKNFELEVYTEVVNRYCLLMSRIKEGIIEYGGDLDKYWGNDIAAHLQEYYEDDYDLDHSEVDEKGNPDYDTFIAVYMNLDNSNSVLRSMAVFFGNSQRKGQKYLEPFSIDFDYTRDQTEEFLVIHGLSPKELMKLYKEITLQRCKDIGELTR